MKFSQNTKKPSFNIVIFCLIIVLIPLAFSTDLTVSFELTKVLLFRVLLSFLLYFLIVNLLDTDWKTLFSKYATRGKVIMIFPMIYLLLAGISTVFSDSSYVSFFGSEYRLHGFLSLIFTILFYYLALYLMQDRNYRKYILNTILFSSLLIVFVSLLQYFGLLDILSPMLEFERSRLYSTLGQPNNLAIYLAAIYPLWFINHKYYSPVIWTVSLLFLLVIFFTYSRVGLAIFLFEVIAIFFFYLPSIKTRIYLGISLLISTSGLIMYFSELTYRYLQIDTLLVRFYLWKATLSVIFEKPFFGHGYDQLQNYIYSYLSPSISHYELSSNVADRAHNILLDSLFQTGFISILILIILIYFIFKSDLLKSKNSLKMMAISITAIFLFLNLNFLTITTSLLLVVILSLLITESNFSIPLNRTNKKVISNKYILLFSSLLVFLICLSSIRSYVEDYYINKYLNNSSSLNYNSLTYINSDRPLVNIINANYISKMHISENEKTEMIEREMNFYLTKTGDYSTYYYNLGKYYRSIKGEINMALSIDNFINAIGYRPFNALYYGEVAVNYYMIGELDMADSFIKKFYKYAPSHKKMLELKLDRLLSIDKILSKIKKSK